MAKKTHLDGSTALSVDGRILSLPAFHLQQHWTETAHWMTQHLRPSLPHVLAQILMHRVKMPRRKMASKDRAMIRPSGSFRAPPPD